MTALGAFDQATAVRRTTGGRYDMQPDPRFSPAAPSGDFQPAVNGGVLIAAMLRAVLDTSPHPHPVATSANFLRVPRIAPAQVVVSWLKQGKTAAVARTSLLQDDKLMIELTVTTGSLDGDARDPALPEAMRAAQALSWTAEPPSLPPVGECVPVAAGGGIRDQVDLRLDPATAGLDEAQPGRDPRDARLLPAAR